MFSQKFESNNSFSKSTPQEWVIPVVKPKNYRKKKCSPLNMILVQEGMRNATQTGIGHKFVIFPFSKKALRFADKLQVKYLSKITKMNLMWLVNNCSLNSTYEKRTVVRKRTTPSEVL